jgi:nigerose phosphorylase
MKDPWVFELDHVSPEETVLNGNRFLLGNGYMGYRGTLEEAGKEQLAGCLLNGVYDRVAGKWREPVNAPNGLFTRVEGTGGIGRSEQSLDIRHGRMRRRTEYGSGAGKITVTSERFVSHADVHLICLKYTVCPAESGRLVIRTGIDSEVWDANGPHFEPPVVDFRDGVLQSVLKTQELGITIAVCEAIDGGIPCSVDGALRTLVIDAQAGVECTFHKFVSIYTSLDPCGNPVQASRAGVLNAVETGYEGLRAAHDKRWDEYWERCDVRIEGDPEAQFALRYSLYHLLLAAPRHSARVSIPARGLSGQVYKGAVFWDTEMFMTPVFALTDPAVARNLILYRFYTLDGARRKAAEYGWRGAFYAWESQETGDDACTHFNVTDVFTNRPVRTYFRDKQIHISADVSYAIWQYYQWSGDFSIFVDGGAEVLAECARFFHSYACYKPDRQRYELHDVTGPDEYHERVNNNAFTNRMVKFAIDTALTVLERMQREAPEAFDRLEKKIGVGAEMESWRDLSSRLFIPEPDPVGGIIQQFDGYPALEDVSLGELKSRMLNPTEYLGGGNGLAVHTQILKQADVVLMLNLFREDYPQAVKRANWEYYEPRTEHGSSLSACAYAMVATEIGRPDWAYEFFLKTATVDLTGKSKQYVGPLYIGGTHPAANGGAWLAAIFGFAGLRMDDSGFSLKPSLPSNWKSIEFSIIWRGRRQEIRVCADQVTVKCIEKGEKR